MEKNRVVTESMRLGRIFFNTGFYVLSLFFLFNAGCLLASWQPKISIITSIFKGDFFIAEFLHDITRQTVFADCELILLNANPPGIGHELDAILPYLVKYPQQIVYRQLAKDPGLYGVWNIGVRMARGKYLTNANLDDRLAPDCYAIHAQLLDQNPDVDLIYSSSYITRKPNETFEKNSWNGLIDYPEFTPQLIKKSNIPSFNPMWRKIIHYKYGFFEEKYKIAGDCEFWVRIVAGGAKFKKAPGIHGLFYYNKSGLSLDSSKLHIQKQEIKSIRKKYKHFFAS